MFEAIFTPVFVAQFQAFAIVVYESMMLTATCFSFKIEVFSPRMVDTSCFTLSVTALLISHDREGLVFIACSMISAFMISLSLPKCFSCRAALQKTDALDYDETPLRAYQNKHRIHR